MVDFLETNNKFNNGQHGFRKGRSCLSQLLQHYEDILEKIKDGKSMNVFYLDFAKAFDKVDHGILLHKLRDHGITGLVGKWLHSFLTARQLKVSLQEELSEQSEVGSGVLQGSVLGPLLFLIQIGDIDATLQHSEATSFADDTRIKKQIACVEDANHLQEDLTRILTWATNNNMALNGDKFELLRYGTQNEDIAAFSYQSDGHSLHSQEHARDLGIYMSEDATFTHHYAKITETARRMCGWIFKSLQLQTTRMHDHTMENSSVTKDRILLPIVVTVQNQGHH